MIVLSTLNAKEWMDQVIKQDEIDKYLIDGKDFIDDTKIKEKLNVNRCSDREYIRSIIKKSLSITTLTPDETATLLNLEDEEMWKELHAAAYEIKRRVYDNRIVFFAPLYCSNLCVNSCRYCGFRKDNEDEVRRILSMEEVEKEAEGILDSGNKRVIAVFGEHPTSDIDYICDSLKAIYKAKKPAPRSGKESYIRRVNVNAAPLSTDDLKKLMDVGIGTYQVFQETYNKEMYKYMHPAGIKSDYRWRLYALHRAMDAGIDDVAIGALFGLYDWKYEMMGLLYHAIDLENRYGIGPHTISVPRLNVAAGSSVSSDSEYLMSDEDFKKLVTIIRLSVPYTGLIVTARETPEVRESLIGSGYTQMDASSKIGIGAYSKHSDAQEKEEQQFLLGDTRTLDECVYSLAQNGIITSFCTAGYRCGRTGDKIMGLLKNCVEGKFCKLNAVLTYKEYLDDYASDKTRELGEKLIEKEMKAIREMPFYKEKNLLTTFEQYYERISQGESDIYI